MLCEKCNKNIATTHYKKITNNHVEELNLCEVCAYDGGFGNMFSFSHAVPIDGILQKFLEAAVGASAAKNTAFQTSCQGCGTKLDDFRKTGKFGCATCYSAFKAHLMPMFGKFQASVKNVGKIPKNSQNNLFITRELDNMREELNLAIKNEEYEKAAILRDKIKNLTVNKE